MSRVKSQPLVHRDAITGRDIVFVAYLDDAGSTGKNLADRQAPYQIVAATLFGDDDFNISEYTLGLLIESLVPEEMRNSFELEIARNSVES